MKHELQRRIQNPEQVFGKLNNFNIERYIQNLTNGSDLTSSFARRSGSAGTRRTSSKAHS